MALNDISCRAWPSNINLKWNRLGGEAGKEESMISRGASELEKCNLKEWEKEEVSLEKGLV